MVNNFRYNEPERLDPQEARLKRITSELDRLSVLERDPFHLSPAFVIQKSNLKDRIASISIELDVRRRAVADAEKKHRDEQSSRSARLLKAAIARFSNAQGLQKQARARYDAERRRVLLAQATAGASRLIFPTNPRNLYGGEAKTRTRTGAARKQQFTHPSKSVPCIERIIRKQVLFARGHGGKGHHTKKRFSVWSMIGC
jgi:hypothetical protein